MKKCVRIVAMAALVSPIIYVSAVAAPRSDLRLFQALWSTAAVDGRAAINDPVYVLIRDGDAVKAIIRGEFGSHWTPPAGVVIDVRRTDWISVWATREGLERLGGDPYVQALHPPLRFVSASIVSEARPAMSLSAFDAAGDQGGGVRVAVVDLDFTGYDILRGRELPPSLLYKSFGEGSSAAGSGHGTAVAEIVHDIAPAAQLFLLQISDLSDLAQAVTWCIGTDVGVVNMSVGTFGEPRNGQSAASQEVNRAADAGIVWCNSMGNQAEIHWGGIPTDQDGDGFLEVSPGNEVIGFRYLGSSTSPPAIIAFMIWDRPPSAGLLFDLEIYSDSAHTVRLATSGGLPSVNIASRVLFYANPIAGTRYYLVIRHHTGALPPALRFDIDFTSNVLRVDRIQPGVTAGSILPPADAVGALGVGAYNYTVTTPGAAPARSYSSQGPTWDNRIKPEIAAGDGVSTATFGPVGFSGTSASSPHVAGAVAVLSSATVSGGLFTYVWSTEDIIRLLRVNSIDFGAVGMDNVYGWGGIVMPPASSDPADFSTVTAAPNPFNSGVEISFSLRSGTAYALRMFDVLGRLVWQTEGMHVGDDLSRVRWNGRDRADEALPSGVYFYRIDTDHQAYSGRVVLLK